MKLFAIIFAVMLCAVSFAENLIKNGDFAQGLKFWNVSNKEIQISATVTAPDGKKAVCLPNNGPTFASAPYRLEFTPGIAGRADSSKLARVEYE